MDLSLKGLKDEALKEFQLQMFSEGDVHAQAVNGVIIDPGHGGTDPGAQGNGLIEEHYNLQISLYQYKRFQELGVPVKITRTKDVYLSPTTRTALVRNSGMKHCISNHINAGGGDGAEFIHSKFSTSKWADLMAAEIKAVGQNIRRVFTRSLNNGLDYYFMHRETGAVETVIAEYGFVDSKLDDVVQLRNNQIKYGEAVVKAYCRYAGFAYKAPVVSNPVSTAGDLYVVHAGAFRDIDGAKARVEALKAKGFDAFYKKE